MTSLQPPPPRPLPPGRLEARRRHLLAEIAGDEARLRRPGRRLALALAAVVVLVAAAGTVTLLSRWGTAEASAAQVRERITQGLGERSVRGRFSVESRPAQPHRQLHGCKGCRPPLPVPSSFVLGTDGSFSSRALAPSGGYPASVAYDAARDVMTATGSLGSGPIYVRTTGNNPAFTSFRPEGDLARWVLHAIDSGDARVRVTRIDGRDAWALTLRFTPGDDYYDTYGARVDVIVDQETGLLLQLTQYANDPAYWTSVETIHDLELGTPTRPADFELPVPTGTKVIEHDQGFRTVTPQEAAAVAGYRPLLPADTGGRLLTRLAAAARSEIAFLPGIDAPVYRDAVTARYGAGLDALTVSTRRGTRLDAVPQLTGHTTTIGRGALAGATAYVSSSPTVPGYLSAYHDGLVVEILAPSAAAALAAAESLQTG